MKNIKDLGEKEVILCVTLEECEAIAALLDEKNENDFWKDEKPFKSDHFGEFCFWVFEDAYGKLSYFKRQGYTIHYAKDFFPPQKYYTPQEVKVVTNALIDDIIKEYHESKFQKSLLTILRERLQ